MVMIQVAGEGRIHVSVVVADHVRIVLGIIVSIIVVVIVMGGQAGARERLPQTQAHRLPSRFLPSGWWQGTAAAKSRFTQVFSERASCFFSVFAFSRDTQPSRSSIGTGLRSLLPSA
jgi:hypothetical protein